MPGPSTIAMNERMKDLKPKRLYAVQNGDKCYICTKPINLNGGIRYTCSDRCKAKLREMRRNAG